MSGAPSREIADRIAAGVVASWRARIAHVDGSEVSEDDGVVLAISGLPDPTLSAAVIEHEPSDPSQALARAEERFRAHRGTFGLDVEHGRHASVDRSVEAMGLRPVAARPALAIAVDRVPLPAAPDGLALRRVESPADVSAMAAIESAAFGTVPEVASRLLAPALLERTDVGLFLANLDGDDVAMAYVHAHEDALGVFGVATVPHARGLGIGTAVTAFAIVETNAGADLAWLHSSELGRSMYERMGFERIAEWRVWVRPDPQPG